ncbi:MAG: hypothetical protein LBK00_04295 [Treponema sp.]|nr:hypothetical protein [Treponema sp.]
MPTSFLFASRWYYEYLIKNETEEDIFFIARLSNIVKEKEYAEYIHHYEDGREDHFWLLPPLRLLVKDINQRVLPYTDMLYRTIIISIYPPLLLFNDEDNEFIFIDGYDIMHTFFDEFIVYDGDSNIILTMDDLQRGVSFRPFDETLEIKYAVVLRVTEEMVESGRRKYAGRKYTPEGNDEN